MFLSNTRRKQKRKRLTEGAHKLCAGDTPVTQDTVLHFSFSKMDGLGPCSSQRKGEKKKKKKRNYCAACKSDNHQNVCLGSIFLQNIFCGRVPRPSRQQPPPSIEKDASSQVPVVTAGRKSLLCTDPAVTAGATGRFSRRQSARNGTSM